MPKIELRRVNRTKLESTYIRREFSRNVTSQYGEDGMIAKILELIGVENRWCVEFGAWDGKYLSNTWDLINNKRWSAVLAEGDEGRAAKLAETHAGRRGEVFVKHAFVGWEGPHSLDLILSGAPIPKNFDFLSIDIDGNDWHVWESLKNYRPRLVVVEFNPSASNQLYFVQDRDPTLNQGASLLALIELGKSKGYELAACNHINAMFVLAEEFPKLGISDNSIDAMYEEFMTTEICQGYDGTIFPAGHMMLTWHGLPLLQEDFQILPKALRRYPDPGEHFSGR
jgi:hypothetical protein